MRSWHGPNPSPRYSPESTHTRLGENLMRRLRFRTFTRLVALPCLVSVFLFFQTTSRAGAQNPFTAPDQKLAFQQIQARSVYVPMRDGVRIAVDVLLPMHLPGGGKLPSLFKISRFGAPHRMEAFPGKTASGCSTAMRG